SPTKGKKSGSNDQLLEENGDDYRNGQKDDHYEHGPMTIRPNVITFRLPVVVLDRRITVTMPVVRIVIVKNYGNYNKSWFKRILHIEPFGQKVLTNTFDSSSTKSNWTIVRASTTVRTFLKHCRRRRTLAALGGRLFSLCSPVPFYHTRIEKQTVLYSSDDVEADFEEHNCMT
uniref:Uncharacterized protein n=1 Tax=Romanomermis culicivorax TaxID=13658 RepID=A0A915JZ72_ROMCU